MKPSTPHEIHNLTPLQSLAAMPAIRSKPLAVHAVSRLDAALGQADMSAAYETLASFGELERTRNGFKNVDGGTLLKRIHRLRSELIPYTL